MRGRSYYKLRETTFDLYTEQERLPWYYKFLSTLSAWLILAGFIMFNIAYASTPDDLMLNPAYVTGLAAGAVFVGYLSDTALAFLSRSLIYVFDGVLMPVLTASAVGVFSTIVHRALKRTDATNRNSWYLILPLVVSGSATIISASLSWTVYRKLRKIKDLDARRRVHVPLDSQYSPMLPQNVPREVRDMVPDDEAQRRQLMALLMAKQDGKRDGSIDAASSTYRIDFPGNEEGGRPRSGSVPVQSTNLKSRFTIGNLMGRDRSGTAETFKDPRERRREEIERSGILAYNGNGSAPNSAGLKPAWHGQRSSPPLNGSSRFG